MKRFLLFALAVIMFAACSKDAINEQQNMQTIVDEAPETLVVGFEESDETRIQLNEDVKTVWTNGDLVSVFYRSDANQKWEFTGETGARIADLIRVDEGVATEAMKRVVVVYPYNENYYINTDTFNVQATLPAVQSYLKDSYGLNGNIMISQGEYNNISLKSVCGWLKLQLTGNGEKVKSITLKGNNGEQVAGELYINSADATAILSSDAGNADDGETGGAGGGLVFEDAILKEVVLDCGEGVELGAEATAFYIALPPQTFEQGLTVDVNCKGYNPMSITTQKVVAIERNHIQPMAEVAFSSEVRTIANNEIWYTATQKVEKTTWTFDTFGANIISHEWDATTGEGIITFDGDVTTIGFQAFASSHITEITIPDTVTLIDNNAFTLSWLKNITIPKSVKKIGYMAFGHSLLETITFEANSELKTIDSGVFSYCQHLTHITIPSSVQFIGDYAFGGCSSLEVISCHNDIYHSQLLCDSNDGSIEGVALISEQNSYTSVIAYPAGCKIENLTVFFGFNTKIKWGAFAYCNNIKNLYIMSLKEIEQHNFLYCNALKYVDLTNTTILQNDVFTYCKSIKSLSLPVASEIGENCFINNESLTSIDLGCDELKVINKIGNNNPSLSTLRIPAGVITISDSFNSCAAITEVYCKAVTPPALTNSFDSMVAPTIYVPAGSVNAYKSAEGWKEFADYIVGYDFENGVVVEGYGIDDSNLDHNKYLTYVANHSHLLDFESEDYYYWDTYFQHNVNGIMVAEYKFQLAATQNYTIQYISDDSIYIEGNELYVYSESYYNNYDERERRYNTIDLTTIGIQPTDLIVLRVDAANNVVTINDQEISFNKIGAAMSSQYIFSAYDSVSDEGHAYYYDGMIDGAKLYYAKGWDSNGYLTYLGCASTDVNDKTGNVEACWRAKYYNGEIVETTTFANDRYVEDYVPLGMGNM